MKKPCKSLLINMFLMILMSASVSAQEFQITVSAGDIEREESVVRFYLPESVNPGNYVMHSTDGSEIIIQVLENNEALFILPYLPAGEKTTYTFSNESIAESADKRVEAALGSNQIHISSNGNDVLSYFYDFNSPPPGIDERYRRSGYIHPVYSPSGVILTNHLNEIQHPHHSGIWSAWTQTEFDGRFPDFWNIHQNSGRVDGLGKLDTQWDGPVHAGFTARHHFIDLSADEPVVALNEEWKVEVYPVHDDTFHIFDLTVTQTANTDAPLFLPQYRYGGVGFRGHADWDNPDLVQFLTSGGEGREGHGSRVRWVHIGGLSDGNLAGITIMDHPSNYRFPQTVRIHPDEPFFNYAPVQLGDMEIHPGTPYTVRYRYVTYDGEPDIEKIEKLWRDFAYPPGVTVSEF